MATISIRGIRLDTVSIKNHGDDSGVTASYSLLSNADKVLATQEIGGYNGPKITPSASTIGKLNEFLKAYKNDINTVLGLDAE